MITVLAQQAPPTEVAGSSAELWVFAITAVLALASAVSVVVLRNAVHAALMLVINFFAIAVLYAALEAQFLAVVQIVVYAGAIMVLFLFVLMLMGIGTETRFTKRVRGQVTASVLLGLVLLIVLVGAGANRYLGPDAVCPAAGETGNLCRGLEIANEDGNVAGVGRLLFTTYMWPFEATSALLVIAALGAMVLGKRHSSDDDVTDRPPETVEPDDDEPDDEGAAEDEQAPAELVGAGGDESGDPQ
ncbi:MAG TPA: NADH-quinone oxidoreductase subunit J [Euzebyales bacterium]|nr:NADH-quinone oxidoreductase subunit J [Euzebyales bacterium]